MHTSGRYSVVYPVLLGNFRFGLFLVTLRASIRSSHRPLLRTKMDHCASRVVSMPIALRSSLTVSLGHSIYYTSGVYEVLEIGMDRVCQIFISVLTTSPNEEMEQYDGPVARSRILRRVRLKERTTGTY